MVLDMTLKDVIYSAHKVYVFLIQFIAVIQ